MSKLDEYIKLKKFIEYHKKLKWCNNSFELRVFTEGIPSSEITVDEELNKMIRSAFDYVEYSGSSISYSGSYYLGNALKTMLFKVLNIKLDKLAIEAEKEASDVLNHFK